MDIGAKVKCLHVCGEYTNQIIRFHTTKMWKTVHQMEAVLEFLVRKKGILTIGIVNLMGGALATRRVFKCIRFLLVLAA